MRPILTLLAILTLLGLAAAQTPSLTVAPQTLEQGAVTLASVTLAEDGFVVVHAYDTNGELVLTPPLGLVYLEAGTHTGVMIPLAPDLLEANGYVAGTTKNVLPMIHLDANSNQSYEFPEGPDVPVMVNDQMVVAELPLTLSETMMGEGEMMGMSDGTPALTVSDQTTADNSVTLDMVTLAEDGFVVVHAYDTKGELVLTPPLGLVYLEAGTHRNVQVPLDEAFLVLYGYGSEPKAVLPMLHVDANGNMTYEFPEGPDTPVMLEGEMVVAPLELTVAR